MSIGEVELPVKEPAVLAAEEKMLANSALSKLPPNEARPVNRYLYCVVVKNPFQKLASGLVLPDRMDSAIPYLVREVAEDCQIPWRPGDLVFVLPKFAYLNLLYGEPCAMIFEGYVLYHVPKAVADRLGVEPVKDTVKEWQAGADAQRRMMQQMAAAQNQLVTG